MNYKSIAFISSIQLSSFTDWGHWGGWGGMRGEGDSARILFLFFFNVGGHCLWAVLAWAGMSTLWCPSSISSAYDSVAHPPRCPGGWFWRGCHGVWLAWTMQVSVSWHLPEEDPVDPHGSWSCSTPSCWLQGQLLCFKSKQEMQRSFLGDLISKAWILFFSQQTIAFITGVKLWRLSNKKEQLLSLRV